MVVGDQSPINPTLESYNWKKEQEKKGCLYLGDETRWHSSYLMLEAFLTFKRCLRYVRQEIWC